MKTLDQVKAAKAKLELDILNLVRRFSDDNGVDVVKISSKGEKLPLGIVLTDIVITIDI